MTTTTMTTTRPLTDDQRQQLRRDLPREAVKTRAQAGQTLSYVDSVYVIDQLNEVFGHDGWSFTHALPVIRDGSRAVVVVSGLLRAGGVERGDTGVGLATGEKPDALETAIKSAVTDCLKRCARTFGARMGLALYDKGQESVGYSLVAQDVIAAWDNAADSATYDAARKVATRAWPDLVADERVAVRHAQERAASRVPDYVPAANTTTAAPKLSPMVLYTIARIGVALSARTVAAAVLACHGHQIATGPLADAIAARSHTVDLGDLAATLAKASTLNVTPAQWEHAAAALAAFDAATDAATLIAARKTHAAAIVALPDALRAGVKAAADARATALGAPTAASALRAKIDAAQSTEALQAAHEDLRLAANARRIGSQAEIDALADALNARADALAERTAMAVA